jgi:hypothetical protein
MVGSFPGFPGVGTDFGEQFINTVASQSIRRLFSSSAAVDIAIRCSPSSKLLQGNIDSVKMTGRDLVIRNQFEVSEMSFETDMIALDFRSVLQGKISLKQPTQAIAQVTLSESGINRAFQADLVKKRLFQVNSNGNHPSVPAGSLTFSDIQLSLLGGNRLEIRATANCGASETEATAVTIPIALSTSVALERRRKLVFENIQPLADSVPPEHQAASQELTQTFAEILNNMVDLERFDLDGIDLRMNRVEVQGQSLILSGYAQINHFPGMGEQN